MQLDEFEHVQRPEIFKIITDNLDKSSYQLSLTLNKFKDLPHRAIAEQVKCYQKCRGKLPNFMDNRLLFDKVALEQASSEFTASYKSSLIAGDSLIDLTGGLGIDDIYFSKKIANITYCELNGLLANLFEYNTSTLGISNISINNKDSIKLLKCSPNNAYSWIYVDPSRRDEDKRSVDLDYCAPNVYDNMDLFLQKSENVMIKVAPAYDLTEAMRRFTNLTEIHVVAVDGECKEVLLLLNRDSQNVTPKIFAVKLSSKNATKFIISGKLIGNREKNIAKLNLYFYEPDCSVIKANLAPLLSEKFELSFINKLTPYLTSSKLAENFPGRSFEVITSIKYNEKGVKSYLKQNKITKANVTRRNFKLTVAEIRKKLKLKDGGSIYLFFTVNLDGDGVMIVTKKI